MRRVSWVNGGYRGGCIVKAGGGQGSRVDLRPILYARNSRDQVLALVIWECSNSKLFLSVIGIASFAKTSELYKNGGVNGNAGCKAREV